MVLCKSVGKFCGVDLYIYKHTHNIHVYVIHLYKYKSVLYDVVPLGTFVIKTTNLRRHDEIETLL